MSDERQGDGHQGWAMGPVIATSTLARIYFTEAAAWAGYVSETMMNVHIYSQWVSFQYDRAGEQKRHFVPLGMIVAVVPPPNAPYDWETPPLPTIRAVP